MSVRRHMGRIAVTAFALLMTVAVTPAFASVQDLSSVRLQGGDVPAGLSHAGFKVYAHFTRTMSVKLPDAVVRSSSRATSTTGCASPISAARSQW